MAPVWQRIAIRRMAEIHAAIRSPLPGINAAASLKRGHAVWPHDRGYTVTLRRRAGREPADFFADFALERVATRWWLSRYAAC